MVIVEILVRSPRANIRISRLQNSSIDSIRLAFLLNLAYTVFIIRLVFFSKH